MNNSFLEIFDTEVSSNQNYLRLLPEYNTNSRGEKGTEAYSVECPSKMFTKLVELVQFKLLDHFEKKVSRQTAATVLASVSSFH